MKKSLLIVTIMTAILLGGCLESGTSTKKTDNTTTPTNDVKKNTVKCDGKIFFTEVAGTDGYSDISVNLENVKADGPITELTSLAFSVEVANGELKTEIKNNGDADMEYLPNSIGDAFLDYDKDIFVSNNKFNVTFSSTTLTNTSKTVNMQKIKLFTFKAKINSGSVISIKNLKMNLIKNNVVTTFDGVTAENLNK